MIKKKIVIFGSGNHSKVIFSEIIKFKKYDFIGFVDDFYPKGRKIITHKKKNFFNLGKIKDFIKSNKTRRIKIYGIIGVGFNYLREKIANEVFKLDKTFEWETIISKNCILNGKINIGKGSLIMSGVVINTETIIGNHCIINTSSTIDHNNYFKDFSSCGPRVVTGGNVTLGKNSYLGIGSVVKHEIQIGKNTVIGGQSYVIKKCDDNFLYFGVPAKKIKKRKIDQNYLL